MTFPETLSRVVAMLEGLASPLFVPGRAAPPTAQTIMGWLTVDDVREYEEFCRSGPGATSTRPSPTWRYRSGTVAMISSTRDRMSRRSSPKLR